MPVCVKGHQFSLATHSRLVRSRLCLGTAPGEPDKKGWQDLYPRHSCAEVDEAGGGDLKSFFIRALDVSNTVLARVSGVGGG